MEMKTKNQLEESLESEKTLVKQWFESLEERHNLPLFYGSGWIVLDALVMILLWVVSLVVLSPLIGIPIAGGIALMLGFWYEGEKVPFTRFRNRYNFYNWRTGGLKSDKIFDALQRTLKNHTKLLKERRPRKEVIR